jgi:Lipocalin-like domain
MSKGDLDKRLLGTWQLVSSVIRFEDGEFRDQFGRAPSGFLIYTADGYVSAVLGASNRPKLATDDPGIATDAEFASEASSFLAYCGPFTADDERQAVTHGIEVSLFPNWVGHPQSRTVRFAGDQLVLLTDSHMQSDGRKFKVEVTWRRPATRSESPM